MKEKQKDAVQGHVSRAIATLHIAAAQALRGHWTAEYNEIQRHIKLLEDVNDFCDKVTEPLVVSSPTARVIDVHAGETEEQAETRRRIANAVGNALR